MKHALIVLAVLAVCAGGLQAAPAAKPVAGAHDSNAPINISSDSFQADLNSKLGTWSGNVIVTQADMKLRANTVRMSTVNGKADKVTANGNVVVDSPKSGIVTGENGVYSVGPRTVVMTGNVVLKKGKDVMRGAQLTVNLATGQAVLGGGVKGQTQGSTRVQAVFTPNSQ
ncbi:MAG TPA: lipopolysaccharide transport periplasmic protein LptA [Rhizomicrobium sp.]|nr:lipopolysaccharide transport periplasmic protein LptA [Rhizomicrobium sp.]